MTDFLQHFFSLGNLTITPLIASMLISLVINTAVCWGIIHFFYFPKSRNRDYYFTFLLLSTSVYLLISILLRGNEDMGIGAALGLFAIFGIMRYRTESVPIREMTYLFFLIALSVINGKCDGLTILEQGIINLLFVACAWFCERLFGTNDLHAKLVKYDNIDLIQPQHRQELIADLEKRLGLNIDHIEVGAVDFLTDMTMIRVYYKDDEQVGNDINSTFKIPK